MTYKDDAKDTLLRVFEYVAMTRPGEFSYNLEHGEGWDNNKAFAWWIMDINKRVNRLFVKPAIRINYKYLSMDDVNHPVQLKDLRGENEGLIRIVNFSLKKLGLDSEVIEDSQ